METDKRTIYLWTTVALANILAVLAIIPKRIFQLENFIVLGIFLLISVLPVLISQSSSKLKHRFGYGIPVLLLLPIPYFIYDYFTCTGKLCELGPLVFGWAFTLSAVVFALFYTLGIFAKKWNQKIILSVVGIELLALIYLGFRFLN